MASFADPGFFEFVAGVPGGAGEAEAEGAGGEGFHPGGVGAFVSAAVAPAEAGCGAEVEAGGSDDREGDEGKETAGEAEAGGEPVGEVVGAGGDAAEAEVAFVFVAPEGVEGVDGAVGESAGGASEDGPEEGCDDAVDGGFGDAFDGGADDADFVEAFDVASDDAGDCSAAGGKAFFGGRLRTVAAREGMRDGEGVLRHVASGDSGVDEDG